MLMCYTPEMGDKEPTTIATKQYGHLTLVKSAAIEITAKISHCGGWYVRTNQRFKGRGIRSTGEGTYHFTDKAFEKLQAEHDVKMECLLD